MKQQSSSLMRSSENIKVKTDELRAKYDEVQRERLKLEQEIRDLQSKSSSNEGDQYAWQQGEAVKGYSMVQVILVAIIAIVIGRFLGSTSQ